MIQLLFHDLLREEFIIVVKRTYWDENHLLASDSTYATKIYEPDVQSVVEQNKMMFEPDTDAVAETLQALRNSDGIIHSYDSMNDQENSDIQSQIPEEVEPNEESFHELSP